MRGKRLHEIDKDELWRMWTWNVPQEEICARLGIRRGTFWAIKHKLQLPLRDCDKSGKNTSEPPPSPEEIAERAAAIRASWPPGEAEKRLCKSPRVRLKKYAFDHRNLAYSAMD